MPIRMVSASTSFSSRVHGSVSRKTSLVALPNGAVATAPLDLDILSFDKVLKGHQKQRPECSDEEALNLWADYEEGRLKMRAALFIACQSPSGFLTLKEVQKKKGHISLYRGHLRTERSQGTCWSEQKRLAIDPSLSIPEMVAVLLHESRHLHQDLMQKQIFFSLLRPEERILLEQINEADARAFEVHCAYELIKRPGMAAWPAVWNEGLRSNYDLMKKAYLRGVKETDLPLYAMAMAHDSYFYGWNRALFQDYEDDFVEDYVSGYLNKHTMNNNLLTDTLSAQFLMNCVTVGGQPYLCFTAAKYKDHIHQGLSLASYEALQKIYEKRGEPKSKWSRRLKIRRPENIPMVPFALKSDSAEESGEPVSVEGRSTEPLYAYVLNQHDLRPATWPKRQRSSQSHDPYQEPQRPTEGNTLKWYYSRFILTMDATKDKPLKESLVKSFYEVAMEGDIPLNLAILTLIEMGLRAPRDCFPSEFKEYLKTTMAPGSQATASEAMHELVAHWTMLESRVRRAPVSSVQFAGAR